MKRRLFIIISLVSLTLCGFAANGSPSASGWVAIVEGVDYREFRLPGPNRAYVARMDRQDPDLILDTSIARGKLSGGMETVSGMADRYEQSISAWAPLPTDSEEFHFPIRRQLKPAPPVYLPWGSRNDIVVAINGTFYYTDTGVTIGGFIHSGWYAKPFGDLGGGSGFAWGQDRSMFIGECVYHTPEKKLISNLSTGKTLEFHAINFPDRGQKLILYTPQFDRDSQQSDDNAEVLIELTRALGIRSYPDMTVGIVRQISNQEGPIPIPFDHVVVSAKGSVYRQKLLETLRVGDVVGISVDVVSLKEDCKEPLPVDWGNTYASLGGSFFFLKDGEIQKFDNVGATYRHPRTAICYNSSFVYFVVVDGRQKFSIGMTIDELATFCRDELEATWGINQDGGGSSTMWIQGEVMNSPSDGAERPVANGMMMVLVEPMERSEVFQIGDEVKTIEATNIYLGPGTNFAIHSSVPEGAIGTIVPHLNDLNGVYAKESYWWKVDFGFGVGWVQEEAFVFHNRPESNFARQAEPVIFVSRCRVGAEAMIFS